ncbi:hypothetical protein ACIHFC_09975 [Streptomyces sp. NPDC052013]|uniref:hypothetical protein n=1 Tax=Streptomyces sp. NPDC052013 TaxID=3365679 RepID=UPI0037CD8116
MNDAAEPEVPSGRAQLPRATRLFLIAALTLSAAGYAATAYLDSTTPEARPPSPYDTEPPTDCSSPASDPAFCAQPGEDSACEEDARLTARRLAPSPWPVFSPPPPALARPQPYGDYVARLCVVISASAAPVPVPEPTAAPAPSAP